MSGSVGASLGLLVFRIALGVVFVAHGWNHLFGGGKIAGTGRWFESLGMRPGWSLDHALGWFSPPGWIGLGIALAGGFGGAAALLVTRWRPARATAMETTTPAKTPG